MSIAARVRGVLPAALALALASWAPACGPGEPDPEEDRGEPPTLATPVTDSLTQDAVVATARPVAAALMQALSGRLRTAIEEEGVVGAMEFCNVEALPLTAQVAEAQGLAVKRTSLRLRNPDNAPDGPEAAALAWFADRVEAEGSAPDYHVQRLPDGGYRYYQPLVAGAFCLQCHGTPSVLAPGVGEALKRLYPRDQATGYVEGDWRGLLRVTVPAEALPAR